MNKKRIIFTSIVGTIALAALSVSISLAWYAASDRLSVNDLNVDVFTDGKLKVNTSDDIFTFKDELGMRDFDEADRDIVFMPTSSMYQNEWFDENADLEHREKLPHFYDVYNDSVISSATPNLNETTYGFFRKDLYLITNFNFYASLEVRTNKKDDRYSSFLPNEEANEARARQLWSEHPEWGLTKDEIRERLDNLVNCLRISILVLDENEYHYYIIDPYKKNNEHTYYGGRLDNNGDGYYDTYRGEHEGQYYDTEVVYGEVNNRELIKYDYVPLPVSNDDSSSDAQIASSTQRAQFFGDSFHAESKTNCYAYNEEESKSNGFEIVEEPSLSLEDIRKSNAGIDDPNRKQDLLIPCHPNTPSHIVLSIYLEGWDLDCVNATMGACFDITLYFSLIRGID